MENQEYKRHKFDPGGRGHWVKPRCKVCQKFEEDPIHLDSILQERHRNFLRDES